MARERSRRFGDLSDTAECDGWVRWKGDSEDDAMGGIGVGDGGQGEHVPLPPTKNREKIFFGQL